MPSQREVIAAAGLSRDVHHPAQTKTAGQFLGPGLCCRIVGQIIDPGAVPVHFQHHRHHPGMHERQGPAKGGFGPLLSPARPEVTKVQTIAYSQDAAEQRDRTVTNPAHLTRCDLGGAARI